MKHTGTTGAGLRAALAVVLAFTVTPPARAANVTVNAERGAGTVDVRASAVLKSDATTAWRVLTDYDRYAEFIPDLYWSHVVARRGASVTVEQSGEAALWRLRVPIHITFEINEMAPTRLQSRAVAGSLRVLTSCYVLTPVAEGIRLDYLGRVAPRFDLFGHVGLAAIEQNMTRQFQALANEIEGQTRGVLSPSAESTRLAPTSATFLPDFPRDDSCIE